MKKSLFLVSALFWQLSLHAQENTLLIQQLKKHITILASDQFEGRETGTKGEQLSYEYISRQFTEVGLEQKGSNGFLQPFTFTKATKAGTANSLKINGASFKLGADFFPLAYSANAKANGEIARVGYGINAPSLGHNDYKDLKYLKGKIFVMEFSTPDGGGPHSRYAAVADIRQRVDTAIAKGAVAVLFVNSDKNIDDPKQEYRNKITPSAIPVLFLKGNAQALLMKGARWNAELNAELVKEEATGHNVVGYINNGSLSTVVIGAHYDHLGYGDEDASLYRGEPAIHNGADDNASGIAALIELARTLKTSTDKSNNYLFIAFSGEEKGLLGSNYFVKNSTIPLSQINYMLNMDMLGRLKKEEPVLIISGAGTSPAWKITFDYIKIDSLKIKTTESGIGPSDHTSFYLKDVPVLHFFSGTHSDYHKPSDDEPLINYTGETRIIEFILQLIHRLDDKGKIDFTKTKEENSEDAPRFKVTLGVVPDYAYEGKGMRIDGVTDGKPASKAGLKPGDIVIQLGDIQVVDMMSYMKGLGKFNKGETTVVKFMRGEKENSAEVTF